MSTMSLDNVGHPPSANDADMESDDAGPPANAAPPLPEHNGHIVAGVPEPQAQPLASNDPPLASNDPPLAGNERPVSPMVVTGPRTIWRYPPEFPVVTVNVAVQVPESPDESSAADEIYAEFCERFQFENYHMCWICNGYYAPNFGEPSCGVCHAFIFNEPHDIALVRPDRTIVPDSTDESDSDSGNDEPPFNAPEPNNGAPDAGPEAAANGANAPVAGAAAGAAAADAAAVADDDDQVAVDDGGDDDDDEMMAEEPVEEPAEEPVEVRAVRRAAFVFIPPPLQPHQLLHRQQFQHVHDRLLANPPADNVAFARLERPRVADPALPDVREYAELLTRPHIVDSSSNIVDALPVEVLLAIFAHLDDISLWNVSHVCPRWRTILETFIPPMVWKRYTRQRFPLFAAASTPDAFRGRRTDWFRVYRALVGSSFCRSCLVNMRKHVQFAWSSFRSKRLRCDFRSLEIDNIEGITAIPLDESFSNLQATIAGPIGSPYENGLFFLNIMFPEQFPMRPPTVRFITKIVHPNVSRHGDVGCDIIQHNWSLALTIAKLLLSVQSLLTDPFTEVCMEPHVGRLYVEDRPKFNALARSWTRKYAMPHTLL